MNKYYKKLMDHFNTLTPMTLKRQKNCLPDWWAVFFVFCVILTILLRKEKLYVYS